MNLLSVYREKNKAQLFLLSLIGGCLMWLGWPPLHYSILLLMSLVPLLMIEDKIQKEERVSGRKLFFYSFLFFFCWNILTTWWIYYATGWGAAMAIITNSLLMVLPFFAYHKLKVFASKGVAYLGLISFFTAFELLHLTWDFSWPWLTLGNGWAGQTSCVQWYEYTGALGGSVWVWFCNISIFEIINNYKSILAKRNFSQFVFCGLIIFVPLVFSLAIYEKEKKEAGKEEQNIVMVQPNIDPYNEKFTSSVTGQLQKIILQSEAQIDENTILLLWPETAIAEDVDEKNPDSYSSVSIVKDFLKRHRQLRLVTGLNSFTSYESENEKTATARPWKNDEGRWYDIFNSAVLMDGGNTFQVYHKSRLVPGAEITPYPQFFKIFEPLMVNLGGSTGSVGWQDTPSVFRLNKDIFVAPVICYESVYGGYVSEYIKKGANLITIITNDGWWQNTDGYKQHLAYAQLRAVESRKFIARCANTGISAFITPDGNIKTKTKWWEAASLKEKINSDDLKRENTFYTRHGDYIGKISVLFSFSFLLLFIYRKTKSKVAVSK